MKKKFAVSLTLALALIGVGYLMIKMHPETTGFLGSLLRGESVFLYPERLDLGSFEPGAKVEAVFHIRNLSDKAIKVVGGNSTCSCALPSNLPIEVPGGATIDLKVDVTLPKSIPTYIQEIDFITNENNSFVMRRVALSARVSNPIEEPLALEEEQNKDTKEPVLPALAFNGAEESEKNENQKDSPSPVSEDASFN